MAIPSTTTISQIDELPGKTYEFGIGDPRWTMRTQARLYSDRETAVAREYSTNAYDANFARAKRLGIDAVPIEVTLPSSLHRFFTVRDYGDGMSLQDLTEVYTQFGISTKRESNDYNGMLGAGCKSAVAYTNTFTVTSIHEGIKRVAVIVRRPDWSIVMKIVSQQKTDEPSGTEVVVPVSNPEEFATKARNFYKFWMPGRVLVNGKEPEHYVGRKIIDGLYASQSYGNSYVVMGNVPYKIENPQSLFNGSKMKYFHFVAYVENGDVEFTPAREALEYTQQTKDALKKIFVDLEGAVLSTAAKEIADAKTPVEAFETWMDWRNSVGFGLFDDLTYKGKKLEANFQINASVYSISGYYRSQYNTSSWDVTNMLNTMVVTEFDVQPSTNTRRKVKEYISQQTWGGISTVLFTAQKESDIVNEWIPRDKFVSWSDLKAALPKKSKAVRNPTGRPTGSWDYYEGYVHHEGQPIPAKGSLYYVTTQQFNDYKHPADVASVLGIKDVVVIKVPGNRREKFTRDYPNIPNLREEAMKKVVKDGASLLCDEAKRILALDYHTRNRISRLDVSKLDDPYFQEVKDLLVKEPVLLKAYKDNLALANSLDLRYYVQEYRSVAQSKDYIATNYPLVDIGYRGVSEDVYIYMNAKYKVLAERRKNV